MHVAVLISFARTSVSRCERGRTPVETRSQRPFHFGASGRWSRNHRHMKETIVGDLNRLTPERSSQMSDLTKMNATGQFHLGKRPILPVRMDTNIAGHFREECYRFDRGDKAAGRSVVDLVFAADKEAVFHFHHRPWTRSKASIAFDDRSLAIRFRYTIH